MCDHGNADARVQRAILGLALAEHPRLLTIYRLRVEFQARSARALDALILWGLMRRSGISVAPTEAAINFNRLQLP